MNDFDKKWQRISDLLAAEITGKEHPMVSSGRTLFGIKSTAEEKMDQFAREIEEEHAAKRRGNKKEVVTPTAPDKVSDGTESDSAQAHELSPKSERDHKPFSTTYQPTIYESVDDLVKRARRQTLDEANKKLEEILKKRADK